MDIGILIPKYTHEIVYCYIPKLQYVHSAPLVLVYSAVDWVKIEYMQKSQDVLNIVTKKDQKMLTNKKNNLYILLHYIFCNLRILLLNINIYI